jgi:hypothetical protein
LTVLLVYQSPVPTEYEGSWHTQPVLMLCRGEKYLPLPRIEPVFSSCPFCSLVTVVTELFWCYSNTHCHVKLGPHFVRWHHLPKELQTNVGGAARACTGVQISVDWKNAKFNFRNNFGHLPTSKLIPTLVIVCYICFFHYLRACIRERCSCKEMVMLTVLCIAMYWFCWQF